MDRLARLWRITASPAGALAVAAALYAAVLALRFAVGDPDEPVGFLYALPVALLAARFGAWAGLAGAVLAIVLIGAWVQVEDVERGTLSWAARAVVFALTGGAIGWYATRLRAAEAAQRQTAREAEDAVVDIDAKGRIVELNPEAARLIGRPAADLRGRPVESLVPERLLARRETAARFLDAPAYHSLEDVPLVRADGTEVVVDVTLMPRISVQEAAIRAVVRDVSERHRGHEALRHTAALLEAAEDAGGMGSWEWDLKSGQQRWSDGLYRLFGLKAQSVEPAFETFLEVVHPDDRAIAGEAGRRALDEGVGTVDEFRIVRPDGEVRLVEGTGVALRDESGEVRKIIGTTRDITERKRVERQLEGAAAERARVDQISQLLQVTDVALAALALDDMLDELLDRVCEVLPADSGAILLREAPRDELVLRATRGLDPPGPGEPAPSSSVGLAARVIRERRPLVLVGDELAEVRLTALRRMGSVAAAPLMIGDRVLGVLEVGRREPRPIAGSDLGLLQIGAERSALALDHARVFERERHIASTLQQSLLPERLPEIPGVELQARFLPAGEGQEVGGDFYDAFAIGPDRWLMVLGDVCGKGPEAAAFTALVRYTLRAEAIHEPRPGELLGLLNDAILVQSSDLRFCTAVCLLLDVGGGAATLTVAAGGHPMPLIFRADGSVERPDSPGGPLVGALGDVDFYQRRFELRPGDTVVAYTDGLLEAHAPEQILQPADLAAAAAALPTRPLTDFMRALEDAALGTRPAPPRDDIAMLALAIGRSAPPLPGALPDEAAEPGSAA